MDKGFNLRTTAAGSSDFLQAQLTRQNAALHACGYSKINAAAVRNRHLRAGVQRQLRHNFLRQTDNAQVLHDNAIHTNVAQKAQIFCQLRQLAVVDKRVDRNIQAYMMHMRKIYRLCHLLLIKIAGIGTSAERLAAHINGICTGIHRCLQRLPASGWGQQLNIFLLHAFYLSRTAASNLS